MTRDTRIFGIRLRRITAAQRKSLIRSLDDLYLRDGGSVMVDEHGRRGQPIVDYLLVRLHEMGLLDIRDAIKALGGGPLDVEPGGDLRPLVPGFRP